MVFWYRFKKNFLIIVQVVVYLWLLYTVYIMFVFVYNYSPFNQYEEDALLQNRLPQGASYSSFSVCFVFVKYNKSR